ncbi:hypothetical protein F2Q69_00021927 [Brassica cretica]|uniref:Uncharacterized protein n=1 Tax=Brassica cretica TaxID=69181 RepID=A0A8S9Q3M8_BRACR|nr:hypothetical protein F2Q69_00021927 [Brassica cretica]
MSANLAPRPCIYRDRESELPWGQKGGSCNRKGQALRLIVHATAPSSNRATITVQLPDHPSSSPKLPFTPSWLSLSSLMPLTFSLSHDTLVLRSDDLTGVSPRTMARPDRSYLGSGTLQSWSHRSIC